LFAHTNVGTPEEIKSHLQLFLHEKSIFLAPCICVNQLLNHQTLNLGAMCRGFDAGKYI
jgi:hypothetical protein